MFCSKTCLNIFIITNRKIVPCNWCKVKKYNFDMIKKELKTGQVMMMCSLNCLTLYQVLNKFTLFLYHIIYKIIFIFNFI